MPLLTSLLTGIELPFLHRVTRHIPDDGLSDIPRSVRDALNASGVAERLLPNGEVAIGVGSRGIAGLPQIVRATVDWFRERGARPFLVPCMGSHGGATAEGQLRVLEHLGYPVPREKAVEVKKEAARGRSGSASQTRGHGSDSNARTTATERPSVRAAIDRLQKQARTQTDNTVRTAVRDEPYFEL